MFISDQFLSYLERENDRLEAAIENLRSRRASDDATIARLKKAEARGKGPDRPVAARLFRSGVARRSGLRLLSYAGGRSPDHLLNRSAGQTMSRPLQP